METSKLWDSKYERGGYEVLLRTVAEKMQRMRRIVALTNIGSLTPYCKDLEFERSDGTFKYERLLSWISIREMGFNPTFAEVAEDERRDRMLRAMRILNATDAEVVKRYFGFGYDPQTDTEIAKEMGVSRTAIYLRLQRAKRTLAPLLQSFAPRAAA